MWSDSVITSTVIMLPQIRLLTNNPMKIETLRRLGVVVADRVPVLIPANPHSDNYLKAKEARMRHLFG